MYEIWLDGQIEKRYWRIEREQGSVDTLHQLMYRAKRPHTTEAAAK